MEEQGTARGQKQNGHRRQQLVVYLVFSLETTGGCWLTVMPAVS